MLAAWYAPYLLLLCKLSPTARSSMWLQDQWPSIFWVRQDTRHTKCSTISLTTAFACSRARSIIFGENFQLDLCTITFQFTTPEPSEVVSVKSCCLCRGKDIVHNLHCFWQIRMVSVRSVTSRIIGSTRGLLTPGTKTETRDSEVWDSHTTIRPRELPQCFQFRRSSLCQALYDPEQRTPMA